MTLVTGASGAGKSTLVMAFFFAITGNAPSKVISDGCETCAVELFTPSVWIRRTRRPNRVVCTRVGTEGQLEDELAQEVIHRCFGRFFDLTSYVPQQYQRTFLYQSPTEKLESLERLCFGPADVETHPESLKKRSAAQLKELTRRHIEVKSRFETLKQVCTPVEQPTPPVRPEHDTQATLRGLQHELETLHAQERVLRTRADLVQQQERLQVQLEDAPGTTHSLHTLHEQLRLREDRESIIQSLDNLGAPWATHSRGESEAYVVDYTRDIAALKEFTQLQQSITRLTKLEDEVKQLTLERDHLLEIHEGMYQCPACSIELALLNDELVRRSKRKRSDCMGTQEKKKRIRALEERMDHLRGQYKSLDHYRERLVELEALIQPGESLSDLETDLVWIQKYLREETKREHKHQELVERQACVERVIVPELDRATCEQGIERLREQQRITDQLSYLRTRLRETESQTGGIQDLPVLQERKVQVQQHLEQTARYEESCERYELQRQAYERFVAQRDEIQELDRTLALLERRMTALGELRQMVLKTETEMIHRKITQIAEHVNSFAEQMFTEPITVELLTSKKTATQHEKVQVQLEVFYKNMKCDVSLLSGGEQARLNLAFILAFAHAFDVPLLLLDECTSHLDQDLTETVIEQINAVGIPKVVLIAHQLVEGNFQDVLAI